MVTYFVHPLRLYRDLPEYIAHWDYLPAVRKSADCAQVPAPLKAVQVFSKGVTVLAIPLTPFGLMIAGHQHSGFQAKEETLPDH